MDALGKEDFYTVEDIYALPGGVIEIVSSSSRSIDYFTNLFKYRTAGSMEYWIVDPMKQCIMVYPFEKESGEKHPLGEDVPTGIYERFSAKIE